MKKITSLILILILSLSLSFTVLASTDVVEPTETFYVADYANVLTPKTEEYIIRRNEELYASCGGQFCVVTIDFLNDLDAEQYSYALFNEWEIGSSEHNNGCLLLMVVAEDKYWMSCGAGIEDVFTAGKMNTILMNEFEDDFLAGSYDVAAVKTTNAVMDWYESYYSDAPSTLYPDGGTYESYETYDVGYRGGFISFRTIIKVIFIAAVLIFIFGGKNKTSRTSSRRSSNLPFWLFMSSMNNSARRNRYHHTTHRTTYRPPTGGFRSSGGGFRSGGSSFRSGGGGFGRGGGAGRK